MILKVGSRGEEVRELQELLDMHPVDGIFGEATEKAVRLFQMAESSLVMDGIVGEKTLSRLYRLRDDEDLSTDLQEVQEHVNYETHYLSDGEYISTPTSKKYIFLHHTAGWDNPFKVVDMWNNDKVGRIATEFVVGGSCISNKVIDSPYNGTVVKCIPDGGYAWHLGRTGSSYMHKHSVGIEMCNFGWLKDGKTYTGTEASEEQIVKLSKPFRGYSEWHRYSSKQLESLRKLILFVANRDGIDPRVGLVEWIKDKGADAFELNQGAYGGEVRGLLSHSSVRKDKFDVSPQPDLIDMLLSL